ncbi:metalloregulator ArsR/SmtB family transcription factor [Allokutzneria sp. A3M-2-11 16]|uniref:ArsR/SmtB family transcription factor n=1 Tax=Allokutzneria sp. A3M-2-11 16 TaxID=2962043 RepID=UPI0020B82D08|nr:metalloregulator ArsR/SmtB family transcription factor [Allokutzneria sp. A3M-2-11 16]MCP3803389.1 metalloregulator ArsR/SmtB family transcription factor [Allokutzneria sp. A3M-2-11 16]
MSPRRTVRKLGELDTVFSALAHPTRREIVEVLHARGGEVTAGVLAARFEQSWPTTTRHLTVLVDSGLVTVRKDGRERLYALCRDHLVGGLGLWLHNVEIGVIDHRRGRSPEHPSSE